MAHYFTLSLATLDLTHSGEVILMFLVVQQESFHFQFLEAE